MTLLELRSRITARVQLSGVTLDHEGGELKP